MKINWKIVAASPGYKSLKAKYIQDAQDAGITKRPMRKKTELLKHFKWIIARATHHAYMHNVTLDVILNKWEEGKDYWWLNAYQDCNQPKLYKPVLFAQTLKGAIKYYKTDPWFVRDKERQQSTIARNIQWEREKKAKASGRKPRWSMARKKRGY